MSSAELRKDLFALKKSLNQNYYDTVTKHALSSHQSGLFNKNDLKVYWATLNSRGHRNTNEAVSKVEEISNNTSTNYQTTITNGDGASVDKKRAFTSPASPIFAKMYHSLLIHSHQLMSIILKRERCFMIELSGLIAERDRHLKMIQEMSTESDGESMQLEKNKWKLRIDSLKSVQQRKFRKFISRLYECKENEQLSSSPGKRMPREFETIHLISH